MTHLPEIPLWGAILVAFFLIVGSSCALIGSFGLFRLKSFYDRIHAPTLATSWGIAGTALASMIFFSILGSRLVLHELFIGIFITATTPVTLMLLGRATLYRDRAQNNPDVPQMGHDTAEQD